MLLDILMRSGYTLDEIDTASFARAAAYADELITVNDPVGGTVQLPRFQCKFALKNSRSAGEVIRSIRNGSRFYLVLNASGLLEARIENTFALQQPRKAVRQQRDRMPSTADGRPMSSMRVRLRETAMEAPASN